MAHSGTIGRLQGADQGPRAPVQRRGPGARGEAAVPRADPRRRGSSGVWSLAMAERSDAARITAIDLPQVLAGVRGARREPRATRPGRPRRGRLPLHGAPPARPLTASCSPTSCTSSFPRRARRDRSVRRVTAALSPGGELVVIDALAGGDPARDRARSIYALHLSPCAPGGDAFTRAPRWSTGCRDVDSGEGELITLSGPAPALGALIHHRPRRDNAGATDTR